MIMIPGSRMNGGIVHTGNRLLERSRPVGLALSIAVLGLWTSHAPAAGAEVAIPEIPVIKVSPSTGNADALVADWGQPRRPPTLTSKERQAVLEQVSGGGAGGLPLMNNINTRGKTPTLRQVILTVKRPWMVHRAFLSAEGVMRVDARSVYHFDESIPGRAVVGLNLIKGHTYLLDFLIRGEGEGEYSVATSAGVQAFPDPDAERNHVLIALEAENNGWTEVSLSRSAGAFDLHSVEVTLARGPNEEDDPD